MSFLRFLRYPKAVLLSLLVVVVLASSCGGDDDDDASPAATAVPTAAVAAGTDDADGADSTSGGLEVPVTADDEAWKDTRFEFSLDPDIDGLRVYDFDYDSNREHVNGSQYGDVIPVGGAHSGLWQYCGAYDIELYPERAIHAMEHGAVWIAHRSDVDMSAWVAKANEETHLLVSRADFLTVPIVVSAWGAQLESSSPDDPRIDAFIERFLRQGPENAGCVRGGVGLPPSDKGPSLDL